MSGDKQFLTDAHRAKRTRKTARKAETSSSFERAAGKAMKDNTPEEPPKIIRATWNRPPRKD